MLLPIAAYQLMKENANPKERPTDPDRELTPYEAKAIAAAQEHEQSKCSRKRSSNLELET